MATGSWIDSLLNFIIPPAIFIFLAWILYYPFREPLGRLWATIQNWRENRYDQEVELNMVKTINYE